ncbi:MAG: hypothetical protein HC890_18025 [Chloroflexaceae bacterium]|nr:hypothetical protein [Chloroflexaceae bacterium]
MNSIVELRPLGTFTTGIFDEGAAEIPAFDPISDRLFVVNGDSDAIDVLDLSNPSNPTFLFAIALDNLGIDGFVSGAPNSVAVANGIVAVAVAADTVTDLGQVAFFDADGTLLNAVQVGALPDAVSFSPDGNFLVVANEGEPDDGIDPDGSVAIIDLTNGVTNATVAIADFAAFNGRENELRGNGVRIAPGLSAAQDFEPELPAISPDGTTAFVTLQETMPWQS